MSIKDFINDAIQYQDVDMTKEGGSILPEGFTLARLVRYVELGTHPQEFNGQKKDAAPEVQLGWKLYGGVYEGRYMPMWGMPVSNGKNSNCKKVFNGLNWAGDIIHIAQALGRPYMIKILQYKTKADQLANKVDPNFILPPIDPVTSKPYPVPDITEDELVYFFFNKPTKETWDSLYVEGTFDDGKSKNKTQERIMTALNFPGSQLDVMLHGGIPDLPVESVPMEGAVPANTSNVSAPVAPTVPVVPTPPAVPAVPAIPGV